MIYFLVEINANNLIFFKLSIYIEKVFKYINSCLVIFSTIYIAVMKTVRIVQGNKHSDNT